MNDVKWIKLKVGMFDGASFKKIKRAKIEGVADFRDKLTAVWFELLDLGAKVNNSGLFINDEIAYRSYEDIAIMLDRTDKEVELCMNWFIKENMITIINDVYSINNWLKYQNEDGLEKIRKQNRLRQANFRDRQKQILIGEEDNNVIPNVSVTLRNAVPLIDNNTSISNSLSKSNSLKEDNKQDINNKRQSETMSRSKFNWKKEIYFKDEELQKTFLDYLELRQNIKAVNTERAIKLLINNLEKIASDTVTKIKVIEQSIMNSWKGVFPLKNDFNKKEVKKEYEFNLS